MQNPDWKNLETVFDVELGDKVRDRLSGLEGIVAARVEYLTGCTQMAVVAPGLKADGDPREWKYFDWQRLQKDVSHTNEWAEIQASEASQRRDGAGEAPVGKY